MQSIKLTSAYMRLLLVLLLSVSVNDLSAKKINGTNLLKNNNLVGLITDSSTGKGIPGVPVTDGYSFTVTDKNGVYQMAASDSCRLVYYTLPENYEVNVDPQSGLPSFYFPVQISGDKVCRTDFMLTPLKRAERNVTLLMIGDPQCKTDEDVKRFKEETVTDIKLELSRKSMAGSGRVYAFTLGDITFDNVLKWPDMRKSMSTLASSELAVFNTIGNHDHDAAMDNDYDAVHNFIKNFGPTDYSLNRGNVHIVVMDDIICTGRNRPGTWDYKGGFTDQQVKWLEDDLNNVADKAEKEVVLCVHIPFRRDEGGNQKKVLELLSQFKNAHIMAGHTHYPQNYIHVDYAGRSGLPVYEHVHGAACGAWWTCNSNTDGSPNGYSVYEFNESGLNNWYAKSTGRPSDYQMRVWNGNDTYGETYTYTWTEGGTGGKTNIKVDGNKDFADCFVVQVWNDDGPESGAGNSDIESNWKLELITADGKAYPLTRVTANTAMIPAIAFLFNDLKRNTTTYTKKLRHIWYVKAPSGNPADEKGWTIRATQTIPYSGVTNVYECSEFQTDSSCF